MLTIDRAVDLWLGDLERSGYRAKTRNACGSILDRFCDRLPADYDVSKITKDDVRFLGSRSPLSAGTVAQTEAMLSSSSRDPRCRPCK